MRYWKELSLMCCSFLLAAASSGGEEAAAKKAVLASLKDPDSAKFGDFHLVDQGGACLEVNARNGYGGYTGVKYLVLLKTDNKWVPLAEAERLDFCKRTVKIMLK